MPYFLLWKKAINKNISWRTNKNNNTSSKKKAFTLQILAQNEQGNHTKIPYFQVLQNRNN